MNEKLRKLQLTQLEILDVVDKICKENNIEYSLYAGTLLGAVRHKAFIPWDDDLDICMSRENYNRFIKLWPNVQPKGYLLQNKDNTPGFTQSFTKIRKENTNFLQYEWEKGRYHTGIFIDIFPIDRIPEGKISRFLYYWNTMQYQLYTREFVPPKANAVVKIVSKLLLDITPEVKRKNKREKLLKQLAKYNDDKNLSTVAIETMASVKITHSKTLLDSYVNLQFEDKEYMCFAEWEEYLTRKFGDYMQLPPEDQREWRHHPIILDFEHN